MLVAFSALNVGNKADPARIMFVAWIVKARSFMARRFLGLGVRDGFQGVDQRVFFATRDKAPLHPHLNRFSLFSWDGALPNLEAGSTAKPEFLLEKKSNRITRLAAPDQSKRHTQLRVVRFKRFHEKNFSNMTAINVNYQRSK